jgi:hypothetical protein
MGVDSSGNQPRRLDGSRGLIDAAGKVRVVRSRSAGRRVARREWTNGVCVWASERRNHRWSANERSQKQHSLGLDVVPRVSLLPLVPYSPQRVRRRLDVAKRQRSMPRAWGDPQAARSRPPKRFGRPKRKALWFRATLPGVLVVVAGTVLLTRASGSPAGQDSRIDREVGALLAGIPQEERTLGTRTAPVTLQVFADLEDEDSKHWFLRLLPAIIREFVRTKILKIEYRSFKTNTIGSETFVKQQAAALAAGAQDKLWNYVDTFYHEQGQEYTPYVTESYIDGIASQIPRLNIAQWNKDRNDDWRVEEVVEEDQGGRADGTHVTPAYRLGLTGEPLKNFMGSEAITFPGQLHPTSFASASDIAKAIEQIVRNN